MAAQTIGEVVIDGVPHPVGLDLDEGRAELRLGDDVVFMTFRHRGSVLSLVHTEVPPAHRNKGVGEAFVKAVLDFARSSGFVVRPICPFVVSYIRRNPEYLDAVDPVFRARMDESER
jgi:hypothetical protein